MKQRFTKTTDTQYSQQSSRWQTCWRVTGPGVLAVGALLLMALLLPLLLGGLPNMLAIHQWLAQHRGVFMGLQAGFVVGTLYWWPRLMRWKATRHGWEARTYQAACDRKWAAMGMLALVCLVVWVI